MPLTEITRPQKRANTALPATPPLRTIPLECKPDSDSEPAFASAAQNRGGGNRDLGGISGRGAIVTAKSFEAA